MSDFYKIKRGNPSDLRPQDDSQRLADKYQRKGTLICHSEADKESHTLLKFSFNVCYSYNIT